MMDEMGNYEIFNLNDVIADFPPDPNTAAKHRAEILVKSDTLRVVLVTSLAGGRLHDHSAPGPITIHVLSGQFTLTVENEERVMDAGSIAVAKPGVRHAVECTQDGAFLLTIAHMSRIPDTGAE